MINKKLIMVLFLLIFSQIVYSLDGFGNCPFGEYTFGDCDNPEPPPTSAGNPVPAGSPSSGTIPSDSLSSSKSPILATIPQIWNIGEDKIIDLAFHDDNGNLHDPKIEFEFAELNGTQLSKNFIYYTKLTRNSIGNYSATFHVSLNAPEGKYKIIIKSTASPTKILEVPFEIKKQSLVEKAVESVQEATEKVTQKIYKKDVLTAEKAKWAWIIGGSVIGLIAISLLVIISMRIGKKPKKPSYFSEHSSSEN